ncbi:uncharacterized protein I206_104207 [Kwoniella pini CBS 10737]|uniref:C2H2-type domain-containing protein n=1 Tax=Kwoniella pini CBS 10737 TaxID=1296096 RepID=A0A1B9I2E9_9TREE|nr:uncharacterized protein I206_04218 [Kwoniella pini CBS 10737]OCF49694.1 hypothetical protein I206_04218 [Kwoniella pini CBS 10737]
MADQSPPSFDAIFSSQQPPRRSSTSSSFNAYAFQTQPPYSQLDQHQQQQHITSGTNGGYVEEPQSLNNKSSNASMNGVDQRGTGSSSSSISDVMSRTFNVTRSRRQSSLRKESLPFNPEADSTLIATAPKQGINPPTQGYTSPSIGDIMFGGAGQRTQQTHNNQQFQHQQQWPNVSGGGILQQQQQQPPLQHSYLPQQQQHSPFASPIPTSSSAGLDYMTPGSANSLNDQSVYDQYSPYTNTALIPNNQNASNAWSQDFVGQVEASQGYAGNYMGELNSQGDGINEMMDLNEQDALNNELQRIISNASHHSSAQQSREHSPFAQHTHTPDPNSTQSYQNQQSDMQSGHSRHGSFSNSRSPSPFAQSQQYDIGDLISPPVTGQFPVTTTTSQANSPFFNKPQSPPALIIPGQNSPSPVLPPIVTTVVGGPSGSNRRGASVPRQGDLGGSVMGGLLPPANPALEGLTGMAGISPIAPNADGPMIYIQPSTPISGLRDGRGLFDAALRRAGQLAQNGQQGQGDQQQGFSVLSPQSHSLAQHGSSDQIGQQSQANIDNNGIDFAATMAFQASQGWPLQQGHLGAGASTRPRAKSDSFIPSPTADSFDRQALLNLLVGNNNGNHGMTEDVIQDNSIPDQWMNTVNAWRTGIDENDPNATSTGPTLDPRLLPGQENQPQHDALQQLLLAQQQNQSIDSSQQHQLSQLQAQRNKLPPLNTSTASPGQSQNGGNGGGFLKYEPGEFSPTSMAFYQSIGLYPHSASELPGTTSAPFYTTTFGQMSDSTNFQNTAAPSTSFLAPVQQAVSSGRRRSLGGESSNHPAAGAGTPGYGVEFTPANNNSPFGTLRPGVVRGISGGGGHKRAAKSEDFGRVGTGWGVGAGGSTADFLQSITANDGSLLPPMNRGRSMSHSRTSSASSYRSASPALSISSQGSTWSNMENRMDLPEGLSIPSSTTINATTKTGGRKRVAKQKVTSVATEVASTSRRTNSGVFRCPVPGCGSTFTRHFNLKGHLRSHNDERPYKCLYDGCPKAVVGFARQHDCKRHMLLHEGLRPFECEGCGKKFARLDALTRHHKSEQGQECAITHPLPVNPDGTPMSESQYKIYKGVKAPQPINTSPSATNKGRRRSSGVKSEFLSGDDRSGGESDIGGGVSGMDDYDRYD